MPKVHFHVATLRNIIVCEACSRGLGDERIREDEKSYTVSRISYSQDLRMKWVGINYLSP